MKHDLHNNKNIPFIDPQFDAKGTVQRIDAKLWKPKDTLIAGAAVAAIVVGAGIAYQNHHKQQDAQEWATSTPNTSQSQVTNDNQNQ